jgi:3-dehydroquinate dehydratase/shikimate dehydrogenase
MSRSEIVETVTGATLEQIRAARDRATGDLVELRLDYLARPEIPGALEGRSKPVIVTIRPTREGGRFDGPEEVRLGLLAEAIRLGAEYVDLEWTADRSGLPAPGGTRIVLSHHDFAGMPADLDGQIRQMLGAGAAIVKMAVTPARLADCVRLREAMRVDQPHIAIVMGPQGQVSRLCPWLFGSCWTYGGAAAPGQLSVAELQQVYRVQQGTVATALYGVAGAPLVHSASPAMHNAALQACGLDAIYVPFETADADDLLAVSEAFGVQGLSVTAPLKEATFARAAETDDLSRRIGALNTLRPCPGGGWQGRNFDVAGFLAPFETRGRALDGLRAVVLGAGGSARMAVFALASRGARVAVSARRDERAGALAHELGAAVAGFPPEPGWDLLVNTTPSGTWPRVGECPIPADRVRGGCVYDLIYNPPETALLETARAAGAETIGGLEMLVAQACLQFEWWTGRPAPAEAMRAAAAAFVEQTGSAETGSAETRSAETRSAEGRA